MRPEYETEQDLKNERELISWVEEKWKCRHGKLAKKHPLDYALERDGKIVAFAELKCRETMWNEYPTYMISMMKILGARSIHRATGLPVFLIVRWMGGNWGYMDITTEPDYVGWGGRLDRDDEQDMEPCCYYNISEKFTLVL